MTQLLSEIARYQFLLLRVTPQTAAECFKFEVAVNIAEKFSGAFLITRSYLS